jgi:hypothetical protein
MKGLREAQGTTNLQVRQSASDRVQDMIDRYRGRISEDVSNATVLGQQPLAYAQLGVETGGMLRPAAMLGSQYLSGAARASAKGTMGRYNGIGNAVRSFDSFKQRQSNIQAAAGESTIVAGPMFNKSAENSYI